MVHTHTDPNHLLAQTTTNVTPTHTHTSASKMQVKLSQHNYISSSNVFFMHFSRIPFLVLTKLKNKVKTQKPLCLAIQVVMHCGEPNLNQRCYSLLPFDSLHMMYYPFVPHRDAAMVTQNIFGFRKYSFFISFFSLEKVYGANNHQWL